MSEPEYRLGASVPIGFKGLVEYGERRFVDRRPWMPPDWRGNESPFWKSLPDMGDASIAEAAATPSGVAVPGTEPGATEFCHGRGLMAPLELGPEPTNLEQMKAVQRTNPADPNANHNDRYADWIRE